MPALVGGLRFANLSERSSPTSELSGRRADAGRCAAVERSARTKWLGHILNEDKDSDTKTAKVMTSDQQEMCATASRNARALEEMLLTYDDVVRLSEGDAANVVDRCEQIIECMRDCFGA